MSEESLHKARALPKGVYLLDDPVSIDSQMNFWEEADVEADGCEPEDVGNPVPYHLYAVLVTDGGWIGFDEEEKGSDEDRAKAYVLNKEYGAIQFTPDELATDQLDAFLQRARYIRSAA